MWRCIASASAVAVVLYTGRREIRTFPAQWHVSVSLKNSDFRSPPPSPVNLYYYISEPIIWCARRSHRTESLKIRYVLSQGLCVRARSRSAIIRRFRFFFSFSFSNLQLVRRRRPNSIVIIIVIGEISAVFCTMTHKTYDASASDLFHKHNKPRAGGTYLC